VGAMNAMDAKIRVRHMDHLLAERTAVLKVHQAATRRRAVTYRYPRCEKISFATPQKVFVVVDAGAKASRAIVTQHGAGYSHFLAPAHEVSDKVSESWVGEKFTVGGCFVDCIE
ncbi:MAG: hypothetical protein Q9175_005733, partial [Cornicularia normoerica]